MAYHHHHHLSVTITILALVVLLITARMDIEATIMALGIFVIYWVLSSLYFGYAGSKVEERMFLTVMGNIFLFMFVALIAFLSRTDPLSILIGILLSITILLFPVSHSISPSNELRRIVRLPQIKHKYYIPFSSCYRVDLEFPDPLYIRDVFGSDEMEFSWYMKYPPRNLEFIRKPGIVGEIYVEGNRISVDINKKIIKRRPSLAFKVVKKIAK